MPEAPFAVGVRVVAKKSKTGRIWKVTSRRIGNYRMLWPEGGTIGFGGVKAIWKTDEELAERFERV